MGAAENKAVVRRFFEEADRGNFEASFACLSDGHLLHFPGTVKSLDKAGHEQLILAFHSAFPDWHHTDTRLVAEGNLVVVWATARGTHKGTWQGIAATRRSVAITGVAMQRIVNGKIGEEWSCFDSLAFMQQLGAVPTK
jgi:predicted ester cyclase